MKINGISGANSRAGQMGMNQQTDSYSRNIQNQIANAQKRLQELSSNEELSLEEKMKRRQEIQQKISDLNAQLRQHQTEQRKEKQQAKASSMEDMLGGTETAGSTKAGNKGSGFSQVSMAAMISADTSMNQAKVYGSVAASMEGRAGVLESEINMDSGRGASTEKKEEELAEVEKAAQKATSSQLSTLADANKTMEEAAKADNTEKQTEDDAEEEKTKGDEPVETDAPKPAVSQTATYPHVDVRL